MAGSRSIALVAGEGIYRSDTRSQGAARISPGERAFLTFNDLRGLNDSLISSARIQ